MPTLKQLYHIDAATKVRTSKLILSGIPSSGVLSSGITVSAERGTIVIRVTVSQVGDSYGTQWF